MAFKPFEFFSKLDAKSRVFFLAAGLVIVGLMIYIGVRVFGGNNSATGPSRVAGAPQGLQSVPGGKLTPEYYRALVQANAQATQQAKISGGSAVPTIINVPGQQGFSQSATNCTIVCPGDDNCDIIGQISEALRSGVLAQEDANKLLDLTKNKALPDEFSGALNDLLHQTKITPDVARKFLDCYKKYYNGALIAESGKFMDALIKSGQLPLDIANQLLALQRKNLTPAEYAAELQRLVREGKISPAMAAQLLAQYTQQRQAELAKQGVLQLQQMAKTGEITPEVVSALLELQKKNVPVDEYAAALQRLVAAGKLTPAAAAKLLEQYKKQRTGGTGALDNLVNQQEQVLAGDIADLVNSGKISKETGDALLDLQKKNVTPEEYQAYLDRLVKEGKLTPEQARKLLADYKKLYALKQEAQRLKALQSNNAPLGDYVNELKRAVQAGILSPDAAAQLLQEYQAVLAAPTAGPISVDTSIPGSADFAKLQQRLASEQPVDNAAPQVTEQFAVAQTAATDQSAQARLDRVQALQNAMSQQAQDLISRAWITPVMVYQGGTDLSKTKLGSGLGMGTEAAQAKGDEAQTSDQSAPKMPPAIKAGTILFAVLDTTLDSDYPDTPAMATIVDGEFKGAKLLGRMNVVQGKDKMAITFTLMNRDAWLTGKTVNAFAIDPDTARTVMASSVDYHYLLRYGGLFASSFLSGYANAIMNSGATNTTGIFGTSTTRSAFSPGEKIATGLGQVGTAFANVVQTYVNTPPTIKVNSGVGLGILFMADVPQ